MIRRTTGLMLALTLAWGTAATAAPSSGFVTGAGGVRLQFLDFGGRGDPVILLAGLGNTGWIYGAFGTSLARHHRVLALTRRGHGDSGQPHSGYDPDVLAEDLRLFMDREGLARANLVGHSLAGAELTRFAAKYPERVGAIVYLDAAYDRSAEQEVDENDPIPARQPAAADRRSVGAYIAYVRRSRPDLARYWTRDVVADLRHQLAPGSDGMVRWKTRDSTFSALLRAASAAFPNYRAVRGPALAIYAVEEESYRLPPHASRALREKLARYEAGPLARWRRLSLEEFRAGVTKGEIIRMQGGHHIFLHRPARVLATVEAFLSRHPLGGAAKLMRAPGSARAPTTRRASSRQRR